ncbi:MAG: dihydroorotate dehydrogenase electron transfer subunit [Candidatus Hodarchaeota archaeon]
MSDRGERINKPIAVKILEKIKETSHAFTLKFTLEGINPRPGQFFMIWIPGVDEIPMSISTIDNDNKIYGITVAIVGDATEKLDKFKVGDLIGIRGPFGNGYGSINSKEVSCLIGGGVGIACVNPLINEIKEKNGSILVINAAKNEESLIFHSSYQDDPFLEGKYFVSTDDGSLGFKGYAHQLLLHLLKEKEKKIKKIFTCGPELMMHEVLKVCRDNGIGLEASLERMMRCGNGLCGLCAMDPEGLLVCKDGPIFSGKQLEKTSEFGKYTRDFTGYKIPL